MCLGFIVNCFDSAELYELTFENKEFTSNERHMIEAKNGFEEALNKIQDYTKNVHEQMDVVQKENSKHPKQMEENMISISWTRQL